MKKSTLTRVTVSAAAGGAMLLFGGMGTASAAPADGQVDLAIGTAGVLSNVPVQSAAQIAADICGGDVNQLAPAAENVDASGTQQAVCSYTLGSVDFLQNGSTAGAPGQQQGMTPGTADGASYSEEPTEEPAPTEGDETAPDEGAPTTTTTAPAEAPAESG